MWVVWLVRLPYSLWKILTQDPWVRAIYFVSFLCRSSPWRIKYFSWSHLTTHSWPHALFVKTSAPSHPWWHAFGYTVESFLWFQLPSLVHMTVLCINHGAWTRNNLSVKSVKNADVWEKYQLDAFLHQLLTLSKDLGSSTSETYLHIRETPQFKSINTHRAFFHHKPRQIKSDVPLPTKQKQIFLVIN